MSQPVTTNPWMIALINLSVVFGVLGSLGILISAIRFIDPTQKKTAKVETNAPVAVAAQPVAIEQNQNDVIAVIAAAIAAYGYDISQVACIRRISGGEVWTQAARIEAVTVRNQMF